MITISRNKAIAGIKIVEAMRTKLPGTFWQNKRAAHRDLKWDYLSLERATQISEALRKAKVSHRMETVDGFSGKGYAQIRLAVPLDFSLREVKGGRIDTAAIRKEREKAARFRAKVERTIKRLEALRHDRRGDGIKLTRAVRALKGSK